MNWEKIALDGIGKAHFTSYISEIDCGKHKITCGKLVYRSSLFRFNEVYIYIVMKPDKKKVYQLLMKHMAFFKKSYVKTEKVNIDGENRLIIIKGISESIFAGLFSKRINENTISTKSLLKELQLP